MKLTFADLAVMAIYFLFVLGIGVALLDIFLVVCGLVMDDAIYARSLGINGNLWWGVVLMLFGVGMYTLGRRGRAVGPYQESSEAELLEEREHETGLEHEAGEDDR
jgi:hypothetical protein